MHILITVLLAAAFFCFVVWRLLQVGEPPRIDESPRSPYERSVSSDDFQSMVIDNSRRVPVMVDFYAHWCPPCHAFAPVLSDLAEICDGSFLLAKIDCDENEDLAERYAVTVLPTIALFRDGEWIDGFSGYRPLRTLRYFLTKNGIAVPDDARGSAIPEVQKD